MQSEVFDQRITEGELYIGFLGAMITLADGWALTLLLKSELTVMFITVLIEFVPHLIFLPSERKRYMS